jgi:hypothetical protein
MEVSGAGGWEGTVYHLCDHAGSAGLSVAEWNMDISYEFDLGPEGSTVPVSPGAVLMTLSTPRLYLKTGALETGMTWDFAYTLTYIDTSGTGLSLSVPVTGYFQDEGLTYVDVAGTTMSAWHIRSTYEMSSAEISFWDYSATADYFWVEGLGLVLEEHWNTDTGETILAKELVSSSGL